MRVLAGYQPSGKFHLGNYFGSIKPNIDLQAESDESYFIIVDLHALTTIHDADALRENTMDVARDFLACGLDPSHTVLFRQSHIHEHAELYWVLTTVTPVGLLERAVSYKDKIERGIAASAGLFTYPVLQAADILLYDAEKIPVGKDQKQHIEMARDIALKFNNTYGETFILPDAVIQEDVAVVPGTDGQKMSKSYGNTISLFGDEKNIEKTIMSIQTDSAGMHDPKDPETCVIYKIHTLLLDNAEAAALAGEYRNGISYGDAKKRLYTAYMDYFGEMRKKRAALTDEKVLAVLADGEKRAREVASGTMEKVKAAVGLT